MPTTQGRAAVTTARGHGTRVVVVRGTASTLRSARGHSDTHRPVVIVLAPEVGARWVLLMLQSASPVAAGITTYLGRFDHATPILCAVPIFGSTLVELDILADAPPGAGESFTYNLWKIAAGQTIGEAVAGWSGSISGASARELRIVGSLALAPLDKLAMRLQTSNNAAVVNHVVVPKF